MLHYLGKSHRLITSSLGFLLSILPILLTIFDQILSLYFLYIPYFLGWYYLLSIPWVVDPYKGIRYIFTVLIMSGILFLTPLYNQNITLNHDFISMMSNILNQIERYIPWMTSILSLSLISFSWLYGSWFILFIIDFLSLRKSVTNTDEYID